MSSSRSADGRFPVYKLVDKHGENWDTEILENRWNKLLEEHNLPFRRFHVGGKSSAGSRARWLDIYLRKNAYLFDHHGEKIDAEAVYEDWLWFPRLMPAVDWVRSDWIKPQNDYSGRSTPG